MLSVTASIVGATQNPKHLWYTPIDGRGVIDTNAYCHTPHTLGLNPLYDEKKLPSSRRYEIGLREGIEDAIKWGWLPANFSGLWCIDYEHLPPVGAGAIRIWNVLLKVVRELFPRAKITGYAVPRNEKYRTDPREWLVTDAQGPILRKFDFTGPDVYLPGDLLEDWKRHTTLAVQECRRVAPKVPVKVWLCPEYMEGTSRQWELLSPSHMAQIAEHLASLDCSLHIWEWDARNPNRNAVENIKRIQGWFDNTLIPALKGASLAVD
jgi:hypothetical protein